MEQKITVLIEKGLSGYLKKMTPLQISCYCKKKYFRHFNIWNKF